MVSLSFVLQFGRLCGGSPMFWMWTTGVPEGIGTTARARCRYAGQGLTGRRQEGKGAESAAKAEARAGDPHLTLESSFLPRVAKNT